MQPHRLNRAGTLLLSPEELTELTGRKRRTGQMQWLDDNRWPYETGADGRPKVLRDYCEARLSGIDLEAHRATNEPDWSVFDGAA